MQRPDDGGVAPAEGEHAEPGQEVEVAVALVVDEVAALALDVEAVELDRAEHPGQLGVDVLRVEGEVLARALVQHLLQIKGHAVGSRGRSPSGGDRLVVATHGSTNPRRSPPASPVHARIADSHRCRGSRTETERAIDDHQCPQHLARHVGPAPGRHDGLRGRPQRPHAVARRAGRRGRPLLARLVPGTAVHALAGLVHDRALRARPRRLHELGRDRARQPDLRLGPAGGRLPHRRSWARRTCTSTRTSRCRTSTTWPGASRRSGFAEVFETGDKFVGKIPNRYTDFLSDRGLLDAYKQHIADRSYQGENEDGQNATKCVPDVGLDAHAAAARRVRRHVARPRGRQVDRAVRPPGAVLPLRRVPGAARPVGRAGGGGAALPRRRHLHAALDPAPDRRGDGSLRRPLELVPVGLGLRDDDRRRHPRHAPLLRRRHLGHRPRGRRHGRGAGAQGPPRQHVDHLHERPRRDGRQPRADVQVRALRAGGARPADRAAAGRLPSRGWSTRWWSTSTCPPRCARSPVPPPSRDSEGRSLLAAVRGEAPAARSVTVSENWGFAAFETDRHKLVVDEDAVTPCQLFDLHEDPAEDHRPAAATRSRRRWSRRSWRRTSARSSGRRRRGPTPASSRAGTTSSSSEADRPRTARHPASSAESSGASAAFWPPASRRSPTIG